MYSLSLLLTLSSLAVPVFSRISHSHLSSAHRRAAAAAHAKRDLGSNLFPDTFSYSSGFTTAEGISIDGVSNVDLSDSALNVIKVQSGMSHNVVTKEGKTAWQADYPKGSWNPSNTPLGGFGFYLGGSDEFYNAIMNGADEVILGYSIFFEDGFEFNKGGKLPGVFGGEDDEAFGCSGGRQSGRTACFDGRYMWRKNGAGELYTYIPLSDSNSVAQLAVSGTIANNDYGYSVGRGLFTWPTGEWVTVVQRVKLNTVGQSNGEIKVWVNGEEKIDLTGISLRDSDSSTIQGMQFQTFFGGSTSDWASPKDQSAWFADVSGAVISSSSSGNSASSSTSSSASASSTKTTSSSKETSFTKTANSTTFSATATSEVPGQSLAVNLPASSTITSEDTSSTSNETQCRRRRRRRSVVSENTSF